MTNSRRKGRKNQTEGLALAAEHGQVIQSGGAGLDGDDAVLLIGRPPDAYSVEVKSDQSMSLAAMWRQTTRQAGERGMAPLLLWKIDRCGWWAVVDADLAGLADVVRPQAPTGAVPASLSLPTVASTLRRIDLDPMPWLTLLDGTVVATDARRLLEAL